MATRVFADEELARLREFPEISREELFRYFTLTQAGVAFVDPLAALLAAERWLGRPYRTAFAKRTRR